MLYVGCPRSTLVLLGDAQSPFFLVSLRKVLSEDIATAFRATYESLLYFMYSRAALKSAFFSDALFILLFIFIFGTWTS